jgi:hypothetical protein
MIRLLIASSCLAAAPAAAQAAAFAPAAPAIAAPAGPAAAPAAEEKGWGLARSPGACMLHATSANGTVLSIWGLAGQEKIAFILQNRQWDKLREGQLYALELDFLGVRAVPVEATARLDLDSDGPGYFFTVRPGGGGQRGSALIDALAGAEGLSISRDGAAVDTLKLAGSREAMAGLAGCMAELWAAAPDELDKADVAVPVDPTA